MISLARRLALAQEVAELFADECDVSAGDCKRAGLTVYSTQRARTARKSAERAERRSRNACRDCGVSLAHRSGKTRRCDRHAREHLNTIRRTTSPCVVCATPIGGRGMRLYCDAHRPPRKANRTCVTCATPIVGARGPAKFCARCRPVRSSLVYRRAFS